MTETTPFRIKRYSLTGTHKAAPFRFLIRDDESVWLTEEQLRALQYHISTHLYWHEKLDDVTELRQRHETAVEEMYWAQERVRTLEHRLLELEEELCP